MHSSDHLATVAESKAEVGTLLTSTGIIETDVFCEALLSDISSASYNEAFRGLGLTRVSYWLQRDPDAVMTMWEGRDIHTFLERLATSTNPFVARWRGQHRMWSGPEAVERFWNGSRDRLLYWATDEQGAESEITVYADPRQIETYIRVAQDFQEDPSMMAILDRVRRRQGFTRIETWHHETDGDDTVLTVVEAHDLEHSMTQLLAEENELDRRLMNLVRATLLPAGPPPQPARLLARWHA